MIFYLHLENLLPALEVDLEHTAAGALLHRHLVNTPVVAAGQHVVGDAVVQLPVVSCRRKDRHNSAMRHQEQLGRDAFNLIPKPLSHLTGLS